MSSKWECVVATVLFSHWLWGPQLPARRLCERPTADNLWIRNSSMEWRFWSCIVVSSWCFQWSSVNGLRHSSCFAVCLQLGSWAKGASWFVPLGWRLYDYVLGDTDCTVSVSPFAVSMYLCIYVCVYVCMCYHAHTHTLIMHTHTHIYTYTHIYIHTHTYIYIYMCIFTYIHISIYTYTMLKWFMQTVDWSFFSPLSGPADSSIHSIRPSFRMACGIQELDSPSVHVFTYASKCNMFATCMKLHDNSDLK